MPSFLDFLVVVGMVALRIGVPALVVLGLAYLFKRLDRRWEAEAREYAAKQAGEQPVVQPEAPVRRPGTRRQPEAPALPFVIPPVPLGEQRRQIGLAAAGAQPCWGVRGCTADQKAACPAPGHPDQPCWQARFDAEGQIPEDCVNCDIFQRYPMM